MAKLPALVALLATFAAGCAHQGEKRPIELPGDAEIGRYVASQWGADFNQRFGRFAARPGQSSTLVSVQNAHCDPNWGGSVAECTYDVTASFRDGEIVTKQLRSQFERKSDGSLIEVIIVWHELKR
ncbi:hypothetical protein [Phenylobacterium sp.]|uniref:hypothetical protein n=1 Tax=Phenylobacterium sp. TaxID=1871053 RepID=UPI00374D6B37